VAAYLALVAVLAWVGRRKTALLLLLALFILLPAHAAVFGLFCVLVLLVAALPRPNGPAALRRAYYILLPTWILLPAALLAYGLLGAYDHPHWHREGVVWTYPTVLVPLIVLALVGWKKTALGLLIPCLLLLLYLNWPPDDCWRSPRPPVNAYLLDFSRLATYSSSDMTLLWYEAWDWSGWYWLWPNQLASWTLLKWALALVGGAEFVRWRIRAAVASWIANRGVP
jgi:hypothetical protein